MPLYSLDATTGEIIWKKDMRKEHQIRMSIRGIAATPLISVAEYCRFSGRKQTSFYLSKKFVVYFTAMTVKYQYLLG
jgi:outer membrane protein assembly factor BamB